MKVEKKQRKDPNKMDVILRLSVGDGLIFDVLDKCNDRTDLIKNALFYYILYLQKNKHFFIFPRRCFLCTHRHTASR